MIRCLALLLTAIRFRSVINVCFHNLLELRDLLRFSFQARVGLRWWEQNETYPFLRHISFFGTAATLESVGKIRTA